MIKNHVLGIYISKTLNVQSGSHIPGTHEGIRARIGKILTRLPGSKRLAPRVAASSAAFMQGSSRLLASYPYIEASGMAIESLRIVKAQLHLY